MTHYTRGHYLEPAIYLGLFAGLRPSEVLALTWSSVDLDMWQISIRAAYKRKEKRIDPYPKQEDWGEATMPKPLLDYLTTLSAGKKPTDFVAPSLTGGMLRYDDFYKKLSMLCEKARITVVTPHELRHSCTELWVLNGANTEDCGRQLNHSNAETTKLYMHRTDDRLRAMAVNFTLPELTPTSMGKPHLRLV